MSIYFLLVFPEACPDVNVFVEISLGMLVDIKKRIKGARIQKIAL